MHFSSHIRVQLHTDITHTSPHSPLRPRSATGVCFTTTRLSLQWRRPGEDRAWRLRDVMCLVSCYFLCTITSTNLLRLSLFKFGIVGSSDLHQRLVLSYLQNACACLRDYSANPVYACFSTAGFSQVFEKLLVWINLGSKTLRVPCWGRWIII